MNVEPGEVTTVQATVENKGQIPLEGVIEVEAPDNWHTAPSVQTYSLAAGEEQTVTLEARALLEATEGTENLKVVATYGEHVGDKASIQPLRSTFKIHLQTITITWTRANQNLNRQRIGSIANLRSKC